MAATSQISPISGSPASSPKTAQPARSTGHKAKVGATGGGVQSGNRFGNLSEIGVPLAVLGIVFAMIAPMPSFLLDVLISANITISVIVLLVSMYITRPVEFSVFPTALLLLTLFRLALNISSSRLILINGNGGTPAG